MQRLDAVATSLDLSEFLLFFNEIYYFYISTVTKKGLKKLLTPELIFLKWQPYKL